jgi:DNA polymerase III subunit gamma/tau
LPITPIVNSQNTPSLNPNPQLPSSPVHQMPIGKLRSTATIGKPIVQADTIKTSVVQEPGNQENKSFTIDKLQVVWDRLITDLQDRKRFSEYVILNRKFTLDGTTIHIEVDNEIQTDLLTISLRTEVLNFLRKELQNSTIHLEVVVSKEEAKTMIYTQADKFKFMAEKNPALNDLRSALGLDYDY